MIITRTPLRISLVGGGTDMPSFYEKTMGAVVSFAIDKYIYIAVNPKFDRRVRLSYSITENVDTVDELKHDLAKETLLHFGKEKAIEVVSIADIPGGGTGLGSSSSFTVGLIRALVPESFSRKPDPSWIAELAYKVEHDLCGHPCGKQDQYAASYGGVNLFRFRKESVQYDSIQVDPKEIEKYLLLLWTGKSRSADDILREQSAGLRSEDKHKIGCRMADLALDLYHSLESGNVMRIGEFLHKNWELKKTLQDHISNSWIDEWYETALLHGAIGGKLCGAGGGGFLLLFAPPKLHNDIWQAVGLEKMDFHIDTEGSKIIYGGPDEIKTKNAVR